MRSVDSGVISEGLSTTEQPAAETEAETGAETEAEAEVDATDPLGLGGATQEDGQADESLVEGRDRRLEAEQDPEDRRAHPA